MEKIAILNSVARARVIDILDERIKTPSDTIMSVSDRTGIHPSILGAIACCLERTMLEYDDHDYVNYCTLPYSPDRGIPNDLYIKIKKLPIYTKFLESIRDMINEGLMQTIRDLTNNSGAEIVPLAHLKYDECDKLAAECDTQAYELIKGEVPDIEDPDDCRMCEEFLNDDVDGFISDLHEAISEILFELDVDDISKKSGGMFKPVISESIIRFVMRAMKYLPSYSDILNADLGITNELEYAEMLLAIAKLNSRLFERLIIEELWDSEAK